MVEPEIGTLVLEVTDEPGLTKCERRREQVESAAQKSPRAKMLKLADKTSNLRALASGDSDEDDAREALSLLCGRIGTDAQERRSTSS